jgi:predicted DNA-binding transcriptional regulator AlpA
MRRTSSLILEAGPSLRITNLTNGRVKIELEDVETSALEVATPTTVYDKTGLSRRLGVSKRSIDNYIRQVRNPLPYTIAMGRSRFLETDVMKWLIEGASPAAKRVKARLGI